MHAVVLGARNLGGAVAAHLVQNGWKAAAVSCSEVELADGVVGLRGDASDPASLREVLERAREELGGLDLVVNAVSAAKPAKDGPFGGGPLREASIEDYRGWGGAVAEQAFVFVSEATRALGDGGGTLIQVTGGSSRRAMPGRGIWSSGAQATRALLQAASIELAEVNIHAALLIVDATIESPKTAGFIGDEPDASAAMDDVARAVAYLAAQTPRSWTHELVITPRLDSWVP